MTRRTLLVIGGLLLALAASIFLAAALGAVSIPVADIVKMLLDRMPFLNLENTWQPSHETIFFQVRLVRTVAALLVGSALAVSGVLFQGLLRNPLADPYIIGTSGGAALGAALAMMLPLGSLAGFGIVPLGAFFGALASVLLVYRLARAGRKTPIVSMLLVGFVVGSMFIAVMSLLMMTDNVLQARFHGLYSFLIGSIAVQDWHQILVLGPLVAAAGLVAYSLAVDLDAFALGEEGAAYVGVDVERHKFLILGLGSFLTACAVSLGGLIGFVGLIVPHAVRSVAGPGHRLLLPASAVAGGTFMVLADAAARTVLAPVELPVGILTVLAGSPFFIYLFRRSAHEYAL